MLLTKYYYGYQIFYCPTDALNYINCRIIKNTFKLENYKTAPCCTVNYTHAQQVGICRHNTDNAPIDEHSEPYL